MTTPPEDAERPKAVTIIGRVWLVLAAILLFKDVVDLILWNVLQPAMPSLLDLASRRDPMTARLQPLFEHYVAVKTVEALFAGAAGVSAFFLLRLRPWARLAVQGACWIVIVYLGCFLAIWTKAWSSRALAEVRTHSVSESQGALGFGAGLGVTLALIAGFAVMIGVLRSRRLRAAFTAAPPATAS
jgi:hypothetical protein